MRVKIEKARKARIEMLPLIDIVFLLLVFFIYAMLSMAVHRALPVALPNSTTAKVDKDAVLSVTVKSDGSVYLDREPVPMQLLAGELTRKALSAKDPGVLLFADRNLTYQYLFKVLDQIRTAGLTRISLQAEADEQR
jgi:biopolymer transport protein ExbD